MLLSLVGALAVQPPSAQAVTIRGTNGPDLLHGTIRADAIYGRSGDDRISGRAGADLLVGGPGRDTIAADGGNDSVVAEEDGFVDVVSCGTGHDVASAELADRVAADCETVSRQLSRDVYTNADSQHATQVEPGSSSFGSTIVTAFQAGRDFSGGAANIGFATSTDGGRSWSSGFLPGLTVFSTPGGTADRASDPTVAYDAQHGVWLIASLAVSPTSTALLVSRSEDGLTWSLPVVVAGTSGDSLAYDKEWIACDNWQASPLRGRCYLAYTDEEERQLGVELTTDGGLAWSLGGTPRIPADGSLRSAVGAIPAPRPDGSLVIAYVSDPEDLAATRSGDGGVTFSPPVQVAQIRSTELPGVRAEALPSVAVDRAGNLYATWHDCRFRTGCTANDVVLARSRDGVSWSAPTRASHQVSASDFNAFTPAIAADPSSPAGRVRLAITYYSLRSESCRFVPCGVVDARRVTSSDAGKTWSASVRLTARPMQLGWIPDTSAGRMLGDYVSTSFAGGHAISVFALASAPVDGRLRQAIFASRAR